MNPITEEKDHRPGTNPARVKRNLSDYNDGANVTHHLGNDDYSGSNLDDPYEKEDNPLLEGKVAYGNDISENDAEDESEISEVEK